MNHLAYFLGAGPGDPELLTVRAERLLGKCPVVYLPPLYEESFAALLAGKQTLVPFDYYFADLIDLVESQLTKGPVAFLVPGDMTFYSPFQALVDALGDRAQVVPGVGAVNAASAFLKKTLELPGVSNRAIIASPRTIGEYPESPAMGDLAGPGVTMLIYMNNLPLPELVDDLRRGYGADVPIALAHRLGLSGQEIVIASLDTIVDKVGDRDFFNLDGADPRPALTLVMVGESLAAQADAAWWDYRRDRVWKYRTAGTEQQ